MEEEIWKDVKGFEGLYKVSNLGRLKNVPHWVTREYTTAKGRKVKNKLYIKEKIIILKKKKKVKPNGKVLIYYGATLKEPNGKYYNKLIHRLVAEAFIPNPNNYPMINHIDCDPSNNQIDNLEWCTAKHNNLHNNRVERSIQSFVNNPKNHRIIILLDKNKNIIKEYTGGIRALVNDHPEIERNSVYRCIKQDCLYKQKYYFKYK